jgi:uncharacterized RDD family membrane protein YckC
MSDPSQIRVPGDFRDKLIIETPEQTVLEFEIAGIGSRFLALAYDTLLQILIGLGLLLIMVVVGVAVPNSLKAGIWFLAVILLAYFVLYFGYFTVFEIIRNGQTPGKKKEGLRVIKDSGRPITPSEAVGRNLMRIVDQLPAFYAVGIVSVLLSRQNKRLGDFVAGTIVVHEKSLEDAKSVWQSTQAGQATPATVYGSERLTPEEFALVETFLNRRSSLPADVRFDMADRIAKQIRSKLSLPRDESLNSEKLLEAIAHERRSSAGYS